MNIGIDARFAIHNRRGIGNYVLNLIRFLAVQDQENLYYLYTDREDWEGILPHQETMVARQLQTSNYLAWEQFSLPLQARRDRLDVLHCTGNTAPLALAPSISLVTTVHDVMYLKPEKALPQSTSLYQRLGRIYRRAVVPPTVRGSAAILTVSEFSKSDILSHFRDLPSERIHVTPLGLNPHCRILAEDEVETDYLSSLGVNSGYLLTLGGYDPRKNTSQVIRAFMKLKGAGGLHEKLVVVGIPNWRQSVFWQEAQALGGGEDVVFTEFVTEGQLVSLYNRATAFLYPSLYEGFGLPPLEAMACGTPVITSQVTSIPEVVGDAALLIDPSNEEALTRAIGTMVADRELRDRLKTQGKHRSAEFSWSRLSAETLRVYRQVKGK